MVFQPFVFYDIGQVWNKDQGGQDKSIASTGGGVRGSLPYSLSVTFTAALPLTAPVSTPLYGDPKAPRVFLQVTRQF
jgi:hemolysin activation/secretion protein